MQVQVQSRAPSRKPYPSDVSDEEWAFAAPYLVLCRLDAPQRAQDGAMDTIAVAAVVEIKSLPKASAANR